MVVVHVVFVELSNFGHDGRLRDVGWWIGKILLTSDGSGPPRFSSSIDSTRSRSFAVAIAMYIYTGYLGGALGSTADPKCFVG